MLQYFTNLAIEATHWSRHEAIRFLPTKLEASNRRSPILINAIQVVYGPTDRLFFQQGNYRSSLQFSTILHIGPVRALCTPTIDH